MAEIVVGTSVIGKEVHRVVRYDVFGVLVHKICTRGKGRVGGRYENELVSMP